MRKVIMKRLVWLIAVILCLQTGFCSSAQSSPEDTTQVKELNFVFVHGMGGNACDFQLLSDSIKEQLPAYIRDYEQAHPGTKIQIDTLQRCYPGYVDVKTWANNIADSINKHFKNKKNLILVGHSMGGKASLYATAHNVGNLTDKVAMVITVNSPIKSLNQYFVAGGGSALNYCQTVWSRLDKGICDSLAQYDSGQDGSWVSHHKHWLAFISGEAAPLSEQFDAGGVDGWPRNMDDGIVPISAQYCDEADVIYYGNYGHSELEELDKVAEPMADQILHYLFGGQIECSVFVKGGNFEHEADWLLGTDRWEDIVGEVPAASGKLQHRNESYLHWQEWEDVVGECLPESKRSSYQVNRVKSFPLLTSVEESRWLSLDSPEDCQLYIRTRAAPRNSVQVDWTIYRQGLLPEGTKRDQYEVEITTATPLTSIKRVTWATENPRDTRLRIWSEAESPFRWFEARWRVYTKQSRQRKVIDEIPGEILAETTQ